ncbi:phosphoribosyltransferase [Planctomycetia bacterium]|nr:phosphoribosyltransferase [Planctomycetia bacterium]
MSWSAQTLLRSLAATAEQLLDFAIPPYCPLCRDVLAQPAQAAVCYCLQCSRRLAEQTGDRCQRCSAAVGPWSSTQRGCVHCRGRTLRFRSAVCLGMYHDDLRRALLSAKWSFSSVQMQSLARLLAHRCAPQLRALQVDRVIPIPQHWRQRLLRHFNPAWLVAEQLAGVLNVPCDIHILRKSRRTRPQKRVSVTQRFDNQKQSYAIQDAAVIRGERILIVDDVLTTGATCSEVAGVLLKAGAAECHVAVIARVLDHSA